jgi:cation:H+ antiporter
MALDLLFLIVGGAVLIGGGEILVRGAAALARSLGVSTMIIGLTVVAYGTSAPELAVSVTAAYTGKPAICAGNIVGSNILNILLVLGATAVVFPLKATAAFLRREVPIMVGISIVFLIMAWDGELSRLDAAILILILVAYTLMMIRIAKGEKNHVVREYEEDLSLPRPRSMRLNVVLIIVGLAMLTGGSDMFVDGAVGMAEFFGVSDTIIGLTLVALGTSLPELATCLIAAYRKHADICLGNVVGSCIYNLVAIGGISGALVPLPFESEMVHVHIPVMVGAAVILWPMLHSGGKITRTEGSLLLASYAAYMAWTISQSV